MAIAPLSSDVPTPSRGARPAIEVRALTKHYRGGVVANEAIDLTIPEGMMLGVLGHNGAGKTTLIRQITGELRPTSGDVRVMGVDVLREHIRARAMMGVVPQDAEPYDHLHADEHLRFFARLRGLRPGEARRRADEMLELLGLTPHRSKLARELSGGLKRKLLVGNALMGDPPVLVLDEPTTGLDPHARREVWALLRDLRGRGRTILMSTHYMEEAEQLCDEVALISGGKLRLRGTVEDMRSQCQNRYKATYEAGAGREAVFGSTQDDVVRELSRRGIEEYALTKTTLEDVYMELSGGSLDGEGLEASA